MRVPSRRPLRVYISRNRSGRVIRLADSYRSPGGYFKMINGRAQIAFLTVYAARDIEGLRRLKAKLRNGGNKRQDAENYRTSADSLCCHAISRVVFVHTGALSDTTYDASEVVSHATGDSIRDIFRVASLPRPIKDQSSEQVSSSRMSVRTCPSRATCFAR